MSAKRRASRAQPKAPTTITNQPSTDIPVVWIESRKDGISYGIRAYGKSVKRNAALAIEEFRKVKAFVELEVPQLTEINQAKLLEASTKIKGKGASPATGSDDALPESKA